MKIELEVTDLSPENRVDKFQKAIKALSKQFGVPATIEQKDHNKEKFPFKAQEDLYHMYKNEFGIIMDNLYSRICTTLGLRPASTFQKAIDSNAPKLGKEIIWNPETGKQITQKDLDRLLREVDKFMNRNIGPMQREFTISQAAVAKIIANLKKTSSLEGVRNVTLDDIRYKDKPWEYYNTYPKLAEAFPGSQERLEFRERVVGNYIQDINDSSRKKIRDTLDQGFLAGKTKSEISQDLFDNFGDLNKNWDRIVDTEGVNIFNAEFIAEEKKDTEEGEPLYFIRREFMDDKTCSFCEQANNPVIARWSETPLQDENIGDPVASIALWEGKTNYGRLRSDWWWSEGPVHPNCFSDDTEVLTDNGWKYFKDVLAGDKIMSINPDSITFDKKPEMECVRHNGLITYLEREEMIHFESRECDIIVTLDHNCLYIEDGKIKQDRASNLIGKNITLPVPGYLEGTNKTLLTPVKISVIKYTGLVYDVELEKWHFLLVKRNGKLAWSGNCRGTWSRYYPEIGDFEL